MFRLLCCIGIVVVAYATGRETGYYEGHADGVAGNENRYERERKEAYDRRFKTE